MTHFPQDDHRRPPPEPPVRPRRHALPPWSWAGAALVAVGAALLALDVPVWNCLWYAFGWGGYLLIIDGLIFRVRGASFVAGRRRELGAMLVWSIPYWFLFEAYNLVLENWYYVFALRGRIAVIAGTFLSFATVLPACFLHAELLRGWRALERRRWPPLRVSRAGLRTLGGFGLACAVLPLVFPRACFWMVWGATLGICEVANYRLGAPSLLRDLERGRPARLLRLLVGGSIAGFVWEALNYAARCKWIYTVPGLEDLKLFEMPWLGFLGFPVLAVEAFTCYALLGFVLRGGRHWERSDAGQRHLRPSKWVGPVLVAALAASAVVAVALDEHTIRSRRPLHSELGFLDQRDRAALERAGLPTPELLVRACDADGGDVAPLARRTGLPEDRVARAVRVYRLALLKGMGVPNATRLTALGVTDAAALARADAGELHRRLSAFATADGGQRPRLAEVVVWVRAAAF